MSGFHRFFRSASDPDDVIPADSPWYWRWGLPGLKASIRYRRLTSGKFDDLQDEAYGRLAAAAEPYESARFACLYGREGGRRLREYVRYLEVHRSIGRSELRRMVRSGDISVKSDDGSVRLRSPWVAMVLGFALFSIGLILIVALSQKVVLLHAPPQAELAAGFVLALFWAYNLLEFTNVALKPFLAAQRRRSELNNALIFLAARSRPMIAK